MRTTRIRRGHTHLQLKRLIDALDPALRLLSTDFLPPYWQILAYDLVHRLLDLLEVLGGEGGVVGHEKVIVQAIVNPGTDRHLGLGV